MNEQKHDELVARAERLGVAVTDDMSPQEIGDAISDDLARKARQGADYLRKNIKTSDSGRLLIEQCSPVGAMVYLLAPALTDRGETDKMTRSYRACMLAVEMIEGIKKEEIEEMRAAIIDIGRRMRESFGDGQTGHELLAAAKVGLSGIDFRRGRS